MAASFVVYCMYGTLVVAATARKSTSRSRLPFIPYYDFLGPFPVGKTEIDGDPAGGFEAVSRMDPIPSDQTSMISEMVDGGHVRWKRFYPDRQSGRISVHFDTADKVNLSF